MSGRDQLQFIATEAPVRVCCGLMSGRDQLQFDTVCSALQESCGLMSGRDQLQYLPCNPPGRKEMCGKGD